MANGEGRVREILQFAVDQPSARPAPPRRDDRYAAETVNSPSGRHRPQRLHCSSTVFSVADVRSAREHHHCQDC